MEKTFCVIEWNPQLQYNGVFDHDSENNLQLENLPNNVRRNESLRHRPASFANTCAFSSSVAVKILTGEHKEKSFAISLDFLYRYEEEGDDMLSRTVQEMKHW
ncbi:hypothetical protein TNCV_2616461 [Trichonephila clavipes]|nr:hypothetical protein TNCV_2616461 [Trichonephila clavipes]